MKKYTAALLLFLSIACIVVITTQRISSSKNALEYMMAKIQNSNSDAFLAVKDDKVIAQWYKSGAPEKIETMSITKSVVALAIGMLITQGKLNSIDQKIIDFYPQLKNTPKAGITIRQLMNHTSRISDLSDARIEILPSPNAIQLALDAPLTKDPQSEFFYNNKATNLLAGIIQKASGKRMDIYIAENLFAPLGITDYIWKLDPAGNPYAMAGLALAPSDLVKIGKLVMQNGRWQEKQLIDPTWFSQMLSTSQPFTPNCGLLWWLIYDKNSQTFRGYKAAGYMGQFLIIYPEKKLICVRLIKHSDNYNEKTDNFKNFDKLCYGLA